MYRTVFWTQREREGEGGMIWENGIETGILSYVKQISSPGCRIQDAWGWWTGMTQRDGMGREMGGGFRIGNTCTPVADSCWSMAKPIQYCKVKKKKNYSLKLVQVEATNLQDFCTWSQNYSHSFRAAAKSLQSCLTLCDPTDGSPPGSSVPGILQAKILEKSILPFLEYE